MTFRSLCKRPVFRMPLCQGIRALLFFWLISGAFAAVPAVGEGARDALWEIVSSCMDSTAQDYCQRCRWPRIESSCPHGGNCLNSTAVWAETPDYVVIRDHKMCGCPEGFVHGLAIPRKRVTGAEDPNRPDGIWRFAWDVAQQKFSDPSTIALVVNPARFRSQDQLHVHILHLREGARQQLVEVPFSQLQDLDGVWQAAAKVAARENLDDYGILVAARLDGGFMVCIEKDSPEGRYTDARCR